MPREKTMKDLPKDVGLPNWVHLQYNELRGKAKKHSGNRAAL